MNKRRILYIGGGRDILETLQKAQVLNLEIHYIQKEKSFNPLVKDLVHKVYLFDYDNLDLLLQKGLELHQELKFESVFSLNESALLQAAYLRQQLALPGNSYQTVSMLKDKYLMRNHLNQKGFSVVRTQLGTHQLDILNFFRKIQADIIVKPTQSSGSFSVFKIRHENEVDSVQKLLESNRVNEFIMEEYLNGPEYSVESFSEQGTHHVLSVTEKMTGENFVELGHIIPARIADAEKSLITQFVKDFLSHLGVVCGPTHTEVKMTSQGLRVIESHDRTGGDRINELVKMAYGIDMKVLAFKQISGEKVAEYLNTNLKDSVAIQFFVAPLGQVQKIEGVDKALHSEGVQEVHLYVKPGDQVMPLRDSLDRAGYVIATADSPTAALHKAQKAVNEIKISI